MSRIRRMFCKSIVLTAHPVVEEAILPEPFDDIVAQSWLDAGNAGDPLTHVENVIVRSVSAAFGHETVRTFGKQLESAGKLWPAAKRYYGRPARVLLR